METWIFRDLFQYVQWHQAKLTALGSDLKGVTEKTELILLLEHALQLHPGDPGDPGGPGGPGWRKGTLKVDDDFEEMTALFLSDMPLKILVSPGLSVLWFLSRYG